MANSLLTSYAFMACSDPINCGAYDCDNLPPEHQVLRDVKIKCGDCEATIPVSVWTLDSTTYNQDLNQFTHEFSFSLVGCGGAYASEEEYNAALIDNYGPNPPEIPYTCCLQGYSASITAVTGPLDYGTTCPENPITNFLGYASVHFEDSCNNVLDCETQIVYLLC